VMRSFSPVICVPPQVIQIRPSYWIIVIPASPCSPHPCCSTRPRNIYSTDGRCPGRSFPKGWEKHAWRVTAAAGRAVPVGRQGFARRKSCRGAPMPSRPFDLPTHIFLFARHGGMGPTLFFRPGRTSPPRFPGLLRTHSKNVAHPYDGSGRPGVLALFRFAGFGLRMTCLRGRSPSAKPKDPSGCVRFLRPMGLMPSTHLFIRPSPAFFFSSCAHAPDRSTPPV